MAINFPVNPTVDQVYSFGNTSWKWNGSTWDVISSQAAPGALPSAFSTISVSGQSDVVADVSADTLTLVAGDNVTITTDSAQDLVTFSVTIPEVPQTNSFQTIAVAGQNSLSANSSTDTLTLVAGTNISITTNTGNDSLTINSTASAAATSFTSLTDATLAGLTIDKIALPAITMLTVTNSGVTAYRFDQYGTENNPTIYAISGTTIAFNLQISNLPFLIQDGTGTNYDVGLVHVATDGTVSTGSAAQGKISGTLYWKVPFSISGGYRYQCQTQVAMVGSIQVKSFISV